MKTNDLYDSIVALPRSPREAEPIELGVPSKQKVFAAGGWIPLENLCFRRGTFSWSMEGNQGTRPIDTQGTFKDRRFEYVGAGDQQCYGEHPRIPSCFFQEQVGAYQPEYFDRLWSETIDGVTTNYKSVMMYQYLLVIQGMQNAVGKRCGQPFRTTQADFAITTSIKIPKEKDTIQLFLAQNEGEVYAAQDGPMGSLNLNIFNGTNGKMLKALVLDYGPQKYFELNKEFPDTDILPGHEFKFELVANCADQADAPNPDNSMRAAGCRFHFGTASEVQRDKV